jgi:hypothetical protein
MKKFTSIAIAFLLMLSVIPAMAGDQTGSAPVMSQAVDKAPPSFQALSKLSVTQRQALTPLTDKELASIEGSQVCVGCANVVVLTQVNACVVCGLVSQRNEASITQSINSR